MSFLSNALIGNPFSTPVGSRIEQATDGTLASENWALNMEICDLVNETEDGPRDAIKAIKKRLNQNVGKNYTVVMYTLTILETCVKNCGKRFHLLACNKEFVQELVKLLSPKNDPPTAVQEKVLSLIQSWASAFQGDPELSGATVVYKDLLAKGIEFPPTDLDSLAPIHTPQKSVSSDNPVTESHSSSQSTAPHSSPSTHVQSPSGTLTPEQRAKLQSELDVVQSNMNVLGEMLCEIKPGQEQPDELELLQELRAICESMQQRLVELINKLPNDSLCEELLRINDDMNNLFLRYSRWEKNRGVGVQSSASVIVNKAIPPTSKPPLKSNDSLIDFDDEGPEQVGKLSFETTVAPKITREQNTRPLGFDHLQSILGLGATGEPAPKSTPEKNGRQLGFDDFDMFAQSRNVTYESSKKTSSTYKDNLNPDQISGGLSTVTQGKPVTPEDREFDEMANWLGNMSGRPEESVTSSDFERFLAERAAAAENLPDLPSIPSATGTSNMNNSSPAKVTKKDDKKADLLTS